MKRRARLSDRQSSVKFTWYALVTGVCMICRVSGGKIGGGEPACMHAPVVAVMVSRSVLACVQSCPQPDVISVVFQPKVSGSRAGV